MIINIIDRVVNKINKDIENHIGSATKLILSYTSDGDHITVHYLGVDIWEYTPTCRIETEIKCDIMIGMQKLLVVIEKLVCVSEGGYNW